MTKFPNDLMDAIFLDIPHLDPAGMKKAKALDQGILLARIDAILKRTVNKRDREIFIRYYTTDDSFARIARDYSLTRSRIHMIVRDITDELRTFKDYILNGNTPDALSGVVLEEGEGF